MKKSNYKNLLPLGFDLQLFAEDVIDPVVPEAEPETFSFKDPQTHIDHSLPKKVGDVDLQVMIGHIIAKSNKTAETKYKGLMKEITDKTDGQFKELQGQIKEFEMKDMSEQDRAEAIAAESVEKANKKSNEMEYFANTNWNLYKENKIDNDIMAALDGHDLYNPSQTKMVLRQMGVADLVDHKTTLKLNIDGETKDMSPKEAGDYFLAQPENAHHLKNNLRAGSGTSQNSSGMMDVSGTINYTRSSLQNAATMKEYSEKMRNKEPVNIIEG